MKMNPSTDRGKTRQIAAGITMLYLEFLNKRFCSLKSDEINTFYHKHIDFDSEGENPRKLIKILDLLTRLFSDGKRANMRGHEAIHLVLLISSLMDDYPQGWQTKLPKAFDEFRERCLLARNAAKNDEESEYSRYFNRYVRLTTSGSNNSDSIELRHQFFINEMIALLNLQKKDPQRNFTQIEREMIYYRDRKTCQVCLMEERDTSAALWNQIDIHHIIPHSRGGETSMENAVLVHRDCHPKSTFQEEKFKEWWQSRSKEKKIAEYVSGNSYGDTLSSMSNENINVEFSKIQTAIINGYNVPKPSWNKVMLVTVEIAIREKGLTIQDIKAKVDGKYLCIEQGKINRNGWKYIFS